LKINLLNVMTNNNNNNYTYRHIYQVIQYMHSKE